MSFRNRDRRRGRPSAACADLPVLALVFGALLLGASVFGALLFEATAVAAPPDLGGGTTRALPDAQGASRNAFSFPATNLSLMRQDSFFIGDSFFQNAWVTAPASTTARDGLGPVFNANACQACHLRDGRGRPPEGGERMLSMLLRISVPPTGAAGEQAWRTRRGVTPDPVYGDQIQNRAIPGVMAEADVTLTWETVAGHYPDGTAFELRRPHYALVNLGYGPTDPALSMSARVAPAMIGAGLLDTIPEAAIRAHEDPDDTDGDGVSGRANWVWDAESRAKALGRFGWKATQPDVRQQVASAFAGDIGVSSSLFPDHLCTAAQSACREAPSGGNPEVSDEILDFVTFYSKTLAVPAQRDHDHPDVIAGKTLFREIGCVACHVETFVTGDDPAFPELSNQTIHPFTDLLLHDMGEGLADDRPVFEANGREWRTPPLWGLGLVYAVNRHSNFLHDGRARGFEEAILWHGGEADRARAAFMALSKADRKRLLVFLRSL